MGRAPVSKNAAEYIVYTRRDNGRRKAVLSNEMKKKATDMATLTMDMSDPRIIITPIVTVIYVEWKQILYAFEDLRNSIQEKTNICLSLNVIDGDDDLHESLLTIDEEDDMERIANGEDEISVPDIRID